MSTEKGYDNIQTNINEVTELEKYLDNINSLIENDEALIPELYDYFGKKGYIYGTVSSVAGNRVGTG